MFLKNNTESHNLLFTKRKRYVIINTRWGISAVGSAQHWQCWGQGFESPMLHHKVKGIADRRCSLLYDANSLHSNPLKRRRLLTGFAQQKSGDFDEIRAQSGVHESPMLHQEKSTRKRAFFNEVFRAAKREVALRAVKFALQVKCPSDDLDAKHFTSRFPKENTSRGIAALHLPPRGKLHLKVRMIQN